MNLNDPTNGTATERVCSEEEEVQFACRGALAWITPEAVLDTLRVFRPYYGPSLTPGAAVEIMLNVGQLFEVLDGGETHLAPQRDVL